MENTCSTCKGALMKSSSEGEIIYILHGPRQCLEETRSQLERAETELQTTKNQLRYLRRSIEEEMRFRAKIGRFNEETWADRFCTPNIHDAIMGATA